VVIGPDLGLAGNLQKFDGLVYSFVPVDCFVCYCRSFVHFMGLHSVGDRRPLVGMCCVEKRVKVTVLVLFAVLIVVIGVIIIVIKRHKGKVL